jgi:inner membrane protein YidH
MKKEGMNMEGMLSPVIAIATLLICIGLFAFFAVLLRLV